MSAKILKFTHLFLLIVKIQFTSESSASLHREQWQKSNKSEVQFGTRIISLTYPLKLFPISPVGCWQLTSPSALHAAQRSSEYKPFFQPNGCGF